MLVRRIFNEKLAQAAYLVVDHGEALVIDPTRDMAAYIDAASRDNARIVAVTETHIHADFVSGSRELAQRTGATLYLSDMGDAEWKYAFASDANVRLIRAGDEIRIGEVRLEAVHTPGHTPEHLTFLLTDTSTSDQPMGAFTGDFIFVGDVGRPDLLERSVRKAGAAESGARTLFRSLREFGKHADWLQLWPGHGAGSACGKGIGAMPQSTLGYEKIANPLLGIASEDEFVRAVLEGQTEPPPYFAHMKRINRDGPEPFTGRGRPERVAASRIGEAIAAGGLVVDTRSAADFGAAHIPGTINIPLNRSFLTWAGWLVPVDADVWLIVDARTGGGIDEALRDLCLIGIERVRGWTGTNAIQTWRAEGRPIQQLKHIEAEEAADLVKRGKARLLDVRNRPEYTKGRIPGTPNIPLGELNARVGEVRTDLPLIVHCQGGSRSAIAASMLQAAGTENVMNLTGGFGGWEKAGLDVEH